MFSFKRIMQFFSRFDWVFRESKVSHQDNFRIRYSGPTHWDQQILLDWVELPMWDAHDLDLQKPPAQNTSGYQFPCVLACDLVVYVVPRLTRIGKIKKINIFLRTPKCRAILLQQVLVYKSSEITAHQFNSFWPLKIFRLRIIGRYEGVELCGEQSFRKENQNVQIFQHNALHNLQPRWVEDSWIHHFSLQRCYTTHSDAKKPVKLPSSIIVTTTQAISTLFMIEKSFSLGIPF